MNIKKFIASLYLYHEHAIIDLKDQTIVDTDPVRLATTYCQGQVDGLMIFDMSETDKEQEVALDIMKEICQKVGVDVYGLTKVRRMEDVKKVLYTGCKKALVSLEKIPSIDVLQEVSLKFGKDKIICAFESIDTLADYLSEVEKYSVGLLNLNVHIVREVAELTQMPQMLQIHQLALNKLLELLCIPEVSGITGNTINQNINQLTQLRNLCKENDLLVSTLESKFAWSDFKLNSDGMLPVVVQDYKTSEVLMVAYMNEEAFLETIKTGKMTYFSRSRQSLWLKGESSGHFQYVKELSADCDMDTLLAKVHQVGAACHTGAYSCFFNEVVNNNSKDIESNPLKVFQDVYDVILDRKLHPKEGSYTNYLFEKGIDKILKKLGEEATEIVIAAKNPNSNEVVYEMSDFLYHMMVLMAVKDVSWEEVIRELANR